MFHPQFFSKGKFRKTIGKDSRGEITGSDTAGLEITAGQRTMSGQK